MAGNEFDHDRLRSVPLLAGFDDSQLIEVTGLLEPVDRGDGQSDEPLFRAGDHAEAFYLLADGEVTLESEDEVYQLHPIAVIGELGALTSRARNCTATLSPDAVLYRVAVNNLLDLFERRPDVGLGFQQNLMHIVAEKIHRDQVRLHDMRKNIVRTQRAMKEMRDLLLESEDTQISEPLHDTIEQLIRQNRRVNYRVAPPAALVAMVRFDDGTAAQVVEVSRTHLAFQGVTEPPPVGTRLSAVLSLSGPEIPISGVVLRVFERRVVVELDPMLEDYAAELEGYLTRVQMLDFLV